MMAGDITILAADMQVKCMSGRCGIVQIPLTLYLSAWLPLSVYVCLDFRLATAKTNDDDNDAQDMRRMATVLIINVYTASCLGCWLVLLDTAVYS